MGLESVVPAGTVLSIFSKMFKQVDLKEAAEDMARIVALLSDWKMRRSDRMVTFWVVTRGPPFFPVPVRYSWTCVLSNLNGVLSKVSAPVPGGDGLDSISINFHHGATQFSHSIVASLPTRLAISFILYEFQTIATYQFQDDQSCGLSLLSDRKR
jgi:hypothetical protein